MDFIKATDALCQQVTLDELGKELGLTGQTLRKARLTTGSSATRNPPQGWEKAARKLALAQAAHFTKLAAKLLASE